MAERVGRFGPLPVRPGRWTWRSTTPSTGFYATGGRAGRRGDFLTSPEVGPLFGAVVARALDGWWEELGRPDPFVVVEAGAGRGRWPARCCWPTPACAPALRYVLVERSAALRVRARTLPRADPTVVRARPGADLDADGSSGRASSGSVRSSSASASCRRSTGRCVVLANELLDNLAFRLLERGERRLAGGAGRDRRRRGRLAEVLVPPRTTAAGVGALAPDAADRGPGPAAGRGGRWLAARCTSRRPAAGSSCVDYADAHRRPGGPPPSTEWLRTYAGHDAVGRRSTRLGQQDITVRGVRRPAGPGRAPPDEDRQADGCRATASTSWWTRAGRVWTERGRRRRPRGAAGPQPGQRGRGPHSTPTGLGAFRVLEWNV